jgi:hypothetical protein
VLRRMEPAAQKLVTTVEQGAQLGATASAPAVAVTGAAR